MLVGLLVGALVDPSPASAAAAPPCQDVLFVGARGSAERGPGTPGWVPTAADPSGFGPAVVAALDALRFSTGLKGKTVAAISVDYPATRAVSPNFLLKIDQYFTGLGNGVDFVDRLLQSRSVSCPHERVVLAGYSQGAMVMHRVLNRYLPSASRSAILARIDAVVLIGDGDRVTGDTTQNFGTMTPARQGIGMNVRSQSGSAATRFSRTVGARVLEVCDRNDPVCDSTGLLADGAWYRVHFGYPKGLALSNAMSTAFTLLRWPGPTPAPQPEPAPRPQPVFTVMNTSETPPDGVWFRNSGRDGDTDRVTGHGVYSNDRVQVECFVQGDAVGAYGNRIWYRVRNLTRPTVPGSGAANSGFLNTHYVDDGMTANHAAAGVPGC